MKRKPVEQIIYEIKQEVAENFFTENPIRKFPEDFLDEQIKKDLKERIKYPKIIKLGPQIIKQGRQRKRGAANFKEIQQISELYKDIEKEAGFKYTEILLPEFALKLEFKRKVQICSAKDGIVLMEFDTYEEAKYLLYSRKKGQWLYKIPKDKGVIKKAVAEYEKYLEKIREKLVKAYKKRKARIDAAEYLAKEAMKEKGLCLMFEV